MTFIVPAYRAEATLPRTVQSIQRQTVRDYEVVIVDDGSPDRTADISATLAAGDPRIVVLRRENGGPSAARNTGIAAARGKWLVFLDSDDTVSPSFLSKMLPALDATPGASVVCCGYDLVDPDGRTIARYKAPDLSPNPFESLARGMHFVIHAAVVRRSIVDEIGYFDEALITNEDWDFWTRVARTGATFAIVDERLVQYWNGTQSNSKAGTLMLTDSEVVARRIAGRDERVKRPDPRYAEGFHGIPETDGWLHSLMSSGGIAIAAGQPTDVLFADGPPLDPVFADSAPSLVDSLFEGLMIGANRPFEDLFDLWPTLGDQLKAFIQRVEEITATPGLARAITLQLEEQLIRTGRFHGVRRLRHTVGAMLGPRLFSVGVAYDTSLQAIQVRVPYVRPRGHFMVTVAPLKTYSGATLTATALQRLAQRPFVWLLGDRRKRDAWLKAVSLAKRVLRKARLIAGPEEAVDAYYDVAVDKPPPNLAPFLADAYRAAVQAGTGPRMTRGKAVQSEPAASEKTDPEDPYSAWNEVYSTADPWNYGSPYEQEKYERTLEIVRGASAERALELACAEGRFTERLASHAESVRAVDVSSLAIERARRRCAGTTNIEFALGDFFNEPIEGEWDLIICSEVLYFVGTEEKLSRVAESIRNAMTLGGRLIMAHAYQLTDDPKRTGFDWGDPYGAETIRTVFARTVGLRHSRGIQTDLYRIDVFTRDDDTDWPTIEDENLPILAPLDRKLARHIVWNGMVRERSEIEASLRPVRLPVLAFHRIAEEGPAALSPWRLPPAEFERQLRFLRRRGFHSITLDQWDREARSGGTVAGRPIILTFDDATMDFRDTAWPLLSKYGYSALVFVVTDNVGSSANWDAHYGPPAPLMGWNDIAALADGGVEFGSHLATHTATPFLDASELLSEAVRSRVALCSRLGRSVRSLALPYGIDSAVSTEVFAAAGYNRVFRIDGGTAPISGARMSTPRVEVNNPIDLQTFARLLDMPIEPPNQGDEL